MFILNRLLWYYKRLKVMDLSEIIARVEEQFRLRKLLALRSQYAVSDVVPGEVISDFQWPFADSQNGAGNQQGLFDRLMWKEDGISQRLPDLQMHSWTYYGEVWRFSSTDTELWRRDLINGGLWPQEPFNKMDYREGNPIGDARVMWEPNRLQQLVDLALAAKVDPENHDQYFSHYQQLLEHWFKYNPFLVGVNYISAMECGLRLVSLFVSISVFETEISRQKNLQTQIVTFVEGHSFYISNRISLHSSAGNHTIAECVGLLLASIYMPTIENADRYKKVALKYLGQESQRQILADGGSEEQATWYLKFIFELLSVALEALHDDSGYQNKSMPADDLSLVSEIEEAVARAGKYLAQFSINEKVIEVGDSDSGWAVSAWFDLFSYLKKKGWNTSKEEFLTEFESSGYSLIHCNDSHWLFDHGSLGMAPNFGHGHADCLSLQMWQGGEPVLIDTGTHNYNLDSQKRRFFRSTLAHNTVRIGGEDQAKQESNFMWSRPYEVKMINKDVGFNEEKDAWVFVQASHSGYSHLNVEHNRYVFISEAGFCLVIDVVSSEEQHPYEIVWHCAAAESKDEKTFLVSSINNASKVGLFTNYGAQKLTGVEGNDLGWWSTSYSQLSPCDVIIGEGQLKKRENVFVSLFIPELSTVKSKLDVNKALADADATELQRYMNEIECRFE